MVSEKTPFLIPPMASVKYDFVVAGAGIIALSTARYLARLAPTATIALVTPHAPMSQTSSLSTECYRDHWPSPTMRSFMARSIQLIDEHSAEGGAFRVTPFGYLYCSKGGAKASEAFLAEARECHGAGGVRTFASAAGVPSPFSSATPRAKGADVYTTTPAALAAFPYLAPDVTSLMHTRNCGWLSAQTMGMDMLDSLLARGAHPGTGAPLTTLIKGHVVGATPTVPGGTRLASVQVAPLAGGAAASSSSPAPMTLHAGAVINATGPFLGPTHRALTSTPRGGPGELPLRTEVHAKVIFRDVLGVIPRETPQVILADPATPLWSPEELEYLSDTHGPAMAARAAAPMPSGAHFRPYGGVDSNAVLMLWEAWHHGVAPSDPPPDAATQYLESSLYPEVAVRGLAHLIPGLRAYFEEGAKGAWMAGSVERAGRGPAHSSLPPAGFPPGGGGEGGAAPSLRPPAVDGGYYTKTEENHPLIGPAPGPGGVGRWDNVYVAGAVSGYGIMAGHGAGELCALHATGASQLPGYAGLMSPLRYQDEGFMRKGGVRDQLLAAGGGQL